MSQVQSIRQEPSATRISKIIAFLYGIVAYAAFFVTILYAIGFIMGVGVPKDINTGTVTSTAKALVVNLILMSVFAIQHSVMARKSFKQWWTQYVPKPVERSTYVLLSSLTLMLLFWQWRPMPAIVWRIEDPDTAVTIVTISFVGWVVVFTSTFRPVCPSRVRVCLSVLAQFWPTRPRVCAATLTALVGAASTTRAARHCDPSVQRIWK